MQMSDWIAGLALLVAGAALGLEIRRWFETKPRLRLSIMADAAFAFGDNGNSKMVLIVTNIGQYSTMITHMIVYGYETQYQRYKNKAGLTTVVLNPGEDFGFFTPKELQPYNQWFGILNYTEELSAYREAGLLYVGVHATHTIKPILLKVPPAQKKAME